MSDADKFEVRYQAYDGYAGGARPQYFKVRADDIDPGSSDKELESLFWELLQEDFQQKVSPEPDNLGDFMAWAREVAKRGDADE